MTGRIVGVLLAAGRGERFGGGKLLVPLPAGPNAGVALGVAACRNLRAAVGGVIAVVRPGDPALVASFAREGAHVVVAANADGGMGASLAAGIAAASGADGFVVALAKAKPGPAAFRTALRDAIEQEREIVGCQGVFNMSATNHNGMDERARVLVTVKGGRFRLLPE